MERVKGIEPSYEAWEAAVLPLNYTRIGNPLISNELSTQAPDSTEERRALDPSLLPHDMTMPP